MAVRNMRNGKNLIMRTYKNADKLNYAQIISAVPAVSFR